MTDIYAMPNVTATSGLLGFTSYINDSAGGLFFPVTLLCIFVIIFISLLSSEGRYNSGSRAWTFSSFVTFILALPLATLGLLASKFMYLSIIMLGLGAVWLVLSNSRD